MLRFSGAPQESWEDGCGREVAEGPGAPRRFLSPSLGRRSGQNRTPSWGLPLTSRTPDCGCCLEGCLGHARSGVERATEGTCVFPGLS